MGWGSPEEEGAGASGERAGASSGTEGEDEGRVTMLRREQTVGQ